MKSDVKYPQLGSDPILEFDKWMKEAVAAQAPYADSMTLSTVAADGKPSARVVLLKGFSDSGAVFYTNYMSEKATELERNPYAALTFFWPAIYRQVRIEGRTEKISRADSEKYFASRPRESQLGAWASEQSREIKSFEILDKKYGEFEKRFVGKSIPCPENWGGFRVIPSRFEFWQGSTRRLHFRFVYELRDRRWVQSLLSS